MLLGRWPLLLRGHLLLLRGRRHLLLLRGRRRKTTLVVRIAVYIIGRRGTSLLKLLTWRRGHLLLGLGQLALALWLFLRDEYK